VDEHWDRMTPFPHSLSKEEDIQIPQNLNPNYDDALKMFWLVG
jgi:hypothetical protein